MQTKDYHEPPTRHILSTAPVFVSHYDSEWSDLLRVTTMGAPPPAPLPPNLRSVSAKQISLVWEAVSADLIYTLQMADPISGHGFLNVYHGPDNEYTCSTGLVRSTTYRFRVSLK